MNYVYYGRELYHHGILGQKWDKRNGPPYPLDASDHSSSEKKAGWRDSLKKTVSSAKQKHQSNLEKKYEKKGMSSSDAEAAAKKRMKVEKVVAAAGAVTLAAAAAYTVKNKFCAEYTDSVLKKGTKFQTIATDQDISGRSRIYAAQTKRDKVIYKGLYGNQLAQSGKKVFNITTEASDDIKVPSRKKAAEVFADLYKSDSTFRQQVDSNMSTYKNAGLGAKQKKLFSKITSGMSDSQLVKEGYDAFNIGLANYTNGAADTFYSKLKSLGYNAIVDMNDSKYSSFKSSKPVILFDTGSLVTSAVASMTEKELKVNNIAQKAIRNGATYAAELGLMVGGVAAMKNSSTYTTATKSSKKKTTENKEEKKT
ncbi:MAG: hypothetical protein LUE29_09785 [Lachnospiraceae bacterium]|nr:hypothetical protein [Lachnospiraceae bacterium]